MKRSPGISAAWRSIRTWPGCTATSPVPWPSWTTTPMRFAVMRRRCGLDPDNPEAHTGLARIWHEQGRYEEAQERYRLVLRLKRDFAPALAGLGQVRAELGDFAEAEQYLRQALRRDGRLAGAWQQLATHLRAKLSEADVAAMNALLAGGSLSREQARRLALRPRPGTRRSRGLRESGRKPRACQRHRRGRMAQARPGVSADGARSILWIA